MANFTPQEIEEMLQEFFDTVGKRQYVGARYVPIFGRKGSTTCEWDNLDAYEPLTIVIHQGNSYTSKQYVPAGVDILNTDYWVQTGNWNAQIEQYRQEVLSFQEQIDDKVPYPIAPESRYGIVGQILSTLANGNTKWVDPVIVTSAIAEPLIEAWLDEHPEATTTVEDGSITLPKLNNDLKDILMKLNLPLVSYNNYTTVLPTLADAGLNTIYSVTMTTNVHQTDYPTAIGYGHCILITIGMSAYKVQWFISEDSSKIMTRTYISNNWSNWASTDTDPYKMRFFSTLVNYNNYATVLPTLGDALINNLYSVTMNAENHQTDYPTEIGYGYCLLLTVGVSAYKVQWFINPNSTKIMTRTYVSNNWSNWSSTDDAPFKIKFYNGILINYNNYTNLLPTLGAAENNTLYVVTMNANGHQPDYPTNFGYGNSLLITVGNSEYRIQYLINYIKSDVIIRTRYRDTWSDWTYLTEHKRRTIVIGSGCDYETLIDGLAAAYSMGNCDVIIKAGTYDVVAEYLAKYGNDFFTPDSQRHRGPTIGKNNKYYFEPGCFVQSVLPVSISSLTARNNFAPFDAGEGDFEIINLHAYSENCRYTIHDDLYSEQDYRHVYKNCYLHQNNANGGYVQCIGGGLGAHGYINIEGCVFESDNAENNSVGIVSWHNGLTGENIQSYINIENCYFKNGHIRFSYYGITTLLSEMNICGCSFKDNTVVDITPEQSTATVINVMAREWNNEKNRS